MERTNFVVLSTYEFAFKLSSIVKIMIEIRHFSQGKKGQHLLIIFLVEVCHRL